MWHGYHKLLQDLRWPVSCLKYPINLKKKSSNQLSPIHFRSKNHHKRVTGLLGWLRNHISAPNKYLGAFLWSSKKGCLRIKQIYNIDFCLWSPKTVYQNFNDREAWKCVWHKLLIPDYWRNGYVESNSKETEDMQIM